MTTKNETDGNEAALRAWAVDVVCKAAAAEVPFVAALSVLRDFAEAVARAERERAVGELGRAHNRAVNVHCCAEQAYDAVRAITGLPPIPEPS